MKKCEERQEKILQYMKDTIRERCFPPTVREICAATGLKSTSTVHAHLKTLERLGYITREAGHNRSIRVEGETSGFGCGGSESAGTA